jgi:hypothetical protein
MFVFLDWRLSEIEAEKEAIASELLEADLEIERLGPELESSLKKIAALVSSRLPGLHKLEYDRVIRIGNGYAKNIVFTALKKWQELKYEYKLVLENDGLSPIVPQVDLVIFDDVGIQLGRATIDPKSGSTSENKRVIDPGESRSYSSVLKLNRNGEPAFFAVRLKPDSLPKGVVE